MKNINDNYYENDTKCNNGDTSNIYQGRNYIQEPGKNPSSS